LIEVVYGICMVREKKFYWNFFINLIFLWYKIERKVFFGVMASEKKIYYKKNYPKIYF
jgi:hypothetical protein